jgi:hypothetical protein
MIDPFAQGTNATTKPQQAKGGADDPVLLKQRDYLHKVHGKLTAVGSTSTAELQGEIYGEMSQSLGRAATNLEIAIVEMERLRADIDQIVVSASTSFQVSKLVDDYNTARSSALDMRHALLVQRQACGFRVKNQELVQEHYDIPPKLALSNAVVRQEGNSTADTFARPKDLNIIERQEIWRKKQELAQKPPKDQPRDHCDEHTSQRQHQERMEKRMEEKAQTKKRVGEVAPWRVGEVIPRHERETHAITSYRQNLARKLKAEKQQRKRAREGRT